MQQCCCVGGFAPAQGYGVFSTPCPALLFASYLYCIMLCRKIQGLFRIISHEIRAAVGRPCVFSGPVRTEKPSSPAGKSLPPLRGKAFFVFGHRIFSARWSYKFRIASACRARALPLPALTRPCLPRPRSNAVLSPYGDRQG